jgi:hypothetical protein
MVSCAENIVIVTVMIPLQWTKRGARRGKSLGGFASKWPTWLPKRSNKADRKAAGASRALGNLELKLWSEVVFKVGFLFYIWSHKTGDGEGIDGIQYIHTPDDYFKWAWRLSRT